MLFVAPSPAFRESQYDKGYGLDGDIYITKDSTYGYMKSRDPETLLKEELLILQNKEEMLQHFIKSLETNKEELAILEQHYPKTKGANDRRQMRKEISVCKYAIERASSYIASLPNDIEEKKKMVEWRKKIVAEFIPGSPYLN